jgi:hypothetical protein
MACNAAEVYVIPREENMTAPGTRPQGFYGHESIAGSGKNSCAPTLLDHVFGMATRTARDGWIDWR